MHSEKQHAALDHSHHLSDYARRFRLSPLKGLQKYYGRDDMIAFAGGLPHEAYFPFHTIGADILAADAFPLTAPRTESSPLAWLWRLFGASKERTTYVSVQKSAKAGDDGLNLATALQYGPATGLASTQRWTHAFSARVFRPAREDFATLVHTGNTDGWGRIARVLCDPGDTILAEEWTYPSALASAAPINVRVQPVAMDGQGMRADALREVLEGWDERRGRRPHVMYTVPIGQNPSGATMGLARKKEIYDVCVEYDIIIAEDDPYYFLQCGAYEPKEVRGQAKAGDGIEAFLSSLEPSFLSVDVEGRVIRIDTFSKTIAPGARLGWFTCAPLFAERLERVGETSTQSPCGLGQALIMKLLETWTFDGYVRWLQGIRTQYKLRRDFFVDLFGEAFELQTSAGATGPWAGCKVYTAYAKAQGGLFVREKAPRKALFSFVPPSAGMFVWIKLEFGQHPKRLRGEEEDKSLEQQFWEQLADAGVLTAPGWFFSAAGEVDGSATDGHLRVSFSNAETEDARRGIQIFAKTLTEFFKA
ncbi:PLP-dependent transferase [Amylostereum chailletii]|nr:PLP-dependent transferase [Amylostereum chailletii]